MDYPKRKSPRIPGYNYSTNNYYFVTICTHNRLNLFGLPQQQTAFGKIAAECLSELPSHFSGITVEQYIVMPNHVHAIIVVEHSPESGSGASLSTVVGAYKAAVSRRIHRILPCQTVWQRSFHEHVIRSPLSYEKIWNYVRYNDLKWFEDCYFCE